MLLILHLPLHLCLLLSHPSPSPPASPSYPTPQLPTFCSPALPVCWLTGPPICQVLTLSLGMPISQEDIKAQSRTWPFPALTLTFGSPASDVPVLGKLP